MRPDGKGLAGAHTLNTKHGSRCTCWYHDSPIGLGRCVAIGSVSTGGAGWRLG